MKQLVHTKSFVCPAESAIRSNPVSQLFEKKIAREHALLEKPRWFTTSEAAQYLRVSVNSIKTMVYRGKIQVYKLGRRNRFLRDDLERLIVLPKH